MPKLKILSGKDMIKIFNLLGFDVQSQKGSHIKLSRILNDAKQVLVVPNHSEIDTGTLKAIIRQASKYVSEAELVKHFYTN